MEYIEKIKLLRKHILESISPLISSKCILTDLPYHDNLGDILIWKGEVDFLSHIGTKLLQTSSSNTFTFPEIDEDVTILLHGGGNFGDLYPFFHEFKKKVISRYKHNRIVMFPQSVWYEDERLIAEDARIMADHKDLYLCARDRWSYDFLCKHFSANNILLVPDMAFFIDDKILAPYRGKESGKTLFFRRLDKEITDRTPIRLDVDSDIRDWPTVERKPKRFFYLDKAHGLAYRLRDSITLSFLTNYCIDILADRFIKDSLVKIGCEFLSPYSKVITTRLHAMILSVLLYKPVEYIDNSTGKLSAFAETWLDGLNSVKKYPV